VIRQLAGRLEGELLDDGTMRRLCATDASEYQEMPLAVAFPKAEDDVREIILFAGRPPHWNHSAHRRHVAGRAGGGPWAGC
jgi:hypothetical protein